MFYALKSVLATMALVATQAAWAEKITVAIPHPPGGGLDQVMQVIKTAAQRQGTEIDIQYLNSCADAVELARRNSKNTFLNIASDVYDPKNPNAKCVLDSDRDGLQLWGSPVNSPYYLCSAPNKGLTFAEMSTQPRKLGIVSSGELMAWLGHALANTKQPNQFKITPYRGGGEVVRAGQAGDIDLWFGSSQIRAFPIEQIACYGSSVRNDPRGLPFIGDLTKSGTVLPEISLVNVLMTNPNNLTKEADAALKNAINSAELKAYIAKNMMSGANFDGAALHNQLIQVNQSVKKMQAK